MAYNLYWDPMTPIDVVRADNRQSTSKTKVRGASGGNEGEIEAGQVMMVVAADDGQPKEAFLICYCTRKSGSGHRHIFSYMESVFEESVNVAITWASTSLSQGLAR